MNLQAFYYYNSYSKYNEISGKNEYFDVTNQLCCSRTLLNSNPGYVVQSDSFDVSFIQSGITNKNYENIKLVITSAFCLVMNVWRSHNQVGIYVLSFFVLRQNNGQQKHILSAKLLLRKPFHVNVWLTYLDNTTYLLEKIVLVVVLLIF